MSGRVVYFLTNEFPPSIIGGLGATCEGLAKGLTELSFRVIVLTVDQVESIRMTELYNPSITVLQLPESLLTTTSSEHLSSVLTTLQEYAIPCPDVIHVHSPQWIHVATELRSTFGVPILYTSHSIVRREFGRPNTTRAMLSQRAQEALYRTADRIVCPSLLESRRLNALFPQTGRRTVTIPNGVEARSVWFDVKESKNSAQPRILYVGRIVPGKGILTLIRALPTIRRRCPGATLTIVGAGSEQFIQRLRRAAKGCGVGPYVTFTGWLNRERLWQTYANGSVLALPSRYESFGLVALESAAAGTPVVISPQVGARAYIPKPIRHTVNSWVPAVWGNTIASLAKNERTMKRSQTYAARILKEHTWSRIAARYAKTYEQVRSSSPRRPVYNRDWTVQKKWLSKPQGHVWIVTRPSRTGTRIVTGYFKFQDPENVNHGGPMVADEVVAWQLAKRLNVPIARMEFAEINGKRGIVSIEHSDSECVMWNKLPSEVTSDPKQYFLDPRAFVRLFVFDVWTCNTDRGVNENLIAHRNSTDALYGFYAIDHNHALLDAREKFRAHSITDPHWMRLENYYKLPTGLEPYILAHRDEAMRVVRQVQGIRQEEIARAIGQVPRDQINEYTKRRMLQLLTHRQRLLKDIVSSWLQRNMKKA